jgi:hypothetical protein
MILFGANFEKKYRYPFKITHRYSFTLPETSFAVESMVVVFNNIDTERFKGPLDPFEVLGDFTAAPVRREPLGTARGLATAL